MRCFAPEEVGTRHPQLGNCGALARAPMFTQVNVHGISRLDQVLKMFVVASENWFLRQSTDGVSDVNALKRKNFL